MPKKKNPSCCDQSLPLGISILAVVAIGVLSFAVGNSVRPPQRATHTREIVTVVKLDPDAIIKNEVQTAVSLLQELYNKSERSEITLNEAQKLGADLLRQLRYGDQGEGYFWADTVEGVNVVLYGRQDVEGINRSEDVVNGVAYVKEIIANGQQPGGGFTDYFYPKMGGTEPLAKRAYSLLFGPFNWVVGTGYYLEDVGG